MFSLWGIVKGLLVRDETDPTKDLSLEIDPAATTNTSMVVKSAQTDNRTLTLPDATDTLIGKATTDILTNKTLDGDNNTIQDLGLSSLKTNVTDASKFLVRDVSGVVVSNTKAVPTGVVVGDSDSQVLTNKTIDADNNTLSNLETDNLKAGVLVTDISLATSNTELPSALAVKTAIDAQNEADEISYDNTTSGLTAVDVQAAIDEVEGRVDTAETGVSNKANRDLGNLTTTAINENLVPSGTRNLGSSAAPWSNLYNETVHIRSAGVTEAVLLPNINTPSGVVTASLYLPTNDNSRHLGLFTLNNNLATRTNSGNVYVESGNAPISGNTGSLNLKTGDSTAADSGNINLETGTASGTRGKIVLQDGSEGTAGHVWTSTGTAGEGAWAAGGGAGANTTLSNLTSPTAINQDLIPSGSRNLGTSSSLWNNGYFSSVRSSGGAPGFQLENSQMTPSGVSANALSFSNLPGAIFNKITGYSLLLETANSTSANNSGNIGISTGTTTGIAGVDSGNINISSGNITAGTGDSGSINITTGSSSGGVRGTISLNGASINANSTQINNVTDPTSAQDAATKNYTDTNFIDKSIVDAKGDLIAATADNTPARLAVGTDGLFLKADSSAGTGLSWDSPSSILGYRSVTATDTATTADAILELSGASFTQTLFTAVGNTGKTLRIVHNGTSLTQVYTLNTTGGQTIGGVASGSYALYTNGEVLTIYSDGANWKILDHKAETGWASYTPTTTGMGTPSGMDFKYRREGDSVRVRGKGVNGVVSAAVGTLSLPGSLSIDTAKIPTVDQTAILGVMYARISATNTATPGVTRGPWPITTQDGVTTAVMLTQGDVDLGNDGADMIFKAMNWNTIANNSEAFTVEFLVPISGWQP